MIALVSGISALLHSPSVAHVALAVTSGKPEELPIGASRVPGAFIRVNFDGTVHTQKEYAHITTEEKVPDFVAQGVSLFRASDLDRSLVAIVGSMTRQSDPTVSAWFDTIACLAQCSDGLHINGEPIDTAGWRLLAGLTRHTPGQRRGIARQFEQSRQLEVVKRALRSTLVVNLKGRAVPAGVACLSIDGEGISCVARAGHGWEAASAALYADGTAAAPAIGAGAVYPVPRAFGPSEVVHFHKGRKLPKVPGQKSIDARTRLVADMCVLLLRQLGTARALLAESQHLLEAELSFGLDTPLDGVLSIADINMPAMMPSRNRST